MNKLLLGVLIASCCLFNSINAKEIPIEDFFKNPEFINVKISPDGKHIAFTFRKDTGTSLAVMRLQDNKVLGAFGRGENRHVDNFFWGNNERIVMTVNKRIGNLDNRGSFAGLHAADLNGKNHKIIMRKSNYDIISTLDSNPERILIVKYMDQRGAKAHELDIYKGYEYFTGGLPAIDSDYFLADDEGDLRFGIEVEYAHNNFDIKGFKFVGKKPASDEWEKFKLPNLSPAAGEYFYPIALSKDNRYAYARSNVNSKKTDILYRVDLQNFSMENIYEHEYVDFDNLIYADDDAVIGVMSEPDYKQYKFFGTSHRTEKLYKKLLNSFPGSNVSFTSFTKDKKKAILRISNDKNPGDFYLFNTDTNKAEYLASYAKWLSPENMTDVKPIKFTARDGLEIHGYLTMPNVSDRKKLPLIVNPHGGPHGIRDSWEFNNEVQFFANRGYAVLQVNFRGSGGYGQAFEERGYREWGKKMQDDVTDATHWAIEQGIADADRICIYGGSYGGYSALMGVIREPNLYQCAVGYVGNYDFDIQRSRSDTGSRKSGRAYLQKVIGNDSEYIQNYSPARNVDKIKADLFLVHGTKDVRVPVQNYYALTNALDNHGIKYESMLKKEGHGFTQEKNKIDLYTQMEKFFDKHIGN